jgi:hypothetical protein
VAGRTFGRQNRDCREELVAEPLGGYLDEDLCVWLPMAAHQRPLVVTTRLSAITNVVVIGTALFTLPIA